MVDLGGGHESFVFTNLSQAGATIEHFDPTLDTLDVRALPGMSAGNPLSHGTVAFESINHYTATLVTTTDSHGNTVSLVTLDHVLPSSLIANGGDLIWH